MNRIRPIKTTMPTLKPKAFRINLEIRPYPGIKASRTFKGRLVRFIYTLFLNVLKPIRNLGKPILSIRYYFKKVNKRKWKYYLILRIYLTFLRIVYKRQGLFSSSLRVSITIQYKIKMKVTSVPRSCKILKLH